MTRVMRGLGSRASRRERGLLHVRHEFGVRDFDEHRQVDPAGPGGGALARGVEQDGAR